MNNFSYFNYGLSFYKNSNAVFEDRILNVGSVLNQSNSSYEYTFNPKTPKSQISNDSFTIVDNGEQFNFDTFFCIGHNPNDIDTSVIDMYFMINPLSLNTLTNSSCNTDLGIDNLFLIAGTSDHNNNFSDSNNLCIVSFDIISNTLTNPQIIQNGSFLSGDRDDLGSYTFSNLSKSVSESTSLYGNANIFSLWLAPVSSIDFFGYTSGIKLNTIFKINRSLNISNTLFSSSDDCSLAANLRMNNNTVSISGGTGYQINDTFTLTDPGSDPATLTITDIDEQGAIIGFDFTYFGRNFTQTPTATYNGSTGVGANINFNNDYSLASIDVVDGGNGYSYNDTISAYDPDTNEEYFYNSTSFEIYTKDIGVLPFLDEKFSIHKIVTKTIDEYSTANNGFFLDAKNNTISNSSNYITFSST
jgi:hypothetical protein